MSSLAKTLKNVKTTLDGTSCFLGGSLPVFSTKPVSEWLGHWKFKLGYSSRIDNLSCDLERRDIAWKALTTFFTAQEQSQPKVPVGSMRQYGLSGIDSSVARHFFVTTYLVSCWTIYDTLYDVYTRLAGSYKTSKNDKPGKNRKLAELFEFNDQDKIVIHCGMDDLFNKQYWWIYKVSYTFRNAFAHEGGRLNGKPILDNDLVGDYFKISGDAKTYLNGLAANSYKNAQNDSLLKTSVSPLPFPSLMTPSAGMIFPWYDEDIRLILEKYNAELDDMLAKMIVWAANSLKDEVECFVGQSGIAQNAMVV